MTDLELRRIKHEVDEQAKWLTAVIFVKMANRVMDPDGGSKREGRATLPAQSDR